MHKINEFKEKRNISSQRFIKRMLQSRPASHMPSVKARESMRGRPLQPERDVIIFLNWLTTAREFFIISRREIRGRKPFIYLLFGVEAQPLWPALRIKWNGLFGLSADGSRRGPPTGPAVS